MTVHDRTRLIGQLHFFNIVRYEKQFEPLIFAYKIMLHSAEKHWRNALCSLPPHARALRGFTLIAPTEPAYCRLFAVKVIFGVSFDKA